MTSPLVSVLIVTWNRKADVLEAIQSVVDQEYVPVEIVVVDNGSTDGTVPVIRAAYQDVTLVALDHNTGITHGRNAGIAVATGEIIFCLDSDASLARDTLTNVVDKFADMPDVGIITCKILNAQTGALDPQTWTFAEVVKADQDREFLSYSLCECGCAVRLKSLTVTSMYDLPG